MTIVKPAIEEAKTTLYPTEDLVEDNQNQLQFAMDRLTRKSMHILRLLCEGGNRSTIMTSNISQMDLARKLHVTRQALSVHLKRLTESGFVQVGRGFVNVTEGGLRAAGYHNNPAILIVRLTPQKQLEAVDRIRQIHTVEAFRVAGDADFALFTEQENLDRTLAQLYSIEGIIEVRTLIATEVLKHTQRTETSSVKRPNTGTRVISPI